MCCEFTIRRITIISDVEISNNKRYIYSVDDNVWVCTIIDEDDELRDLKRDKDEKTKKDDVQKVPAAADDAKKTTTVSVCASLIIQIRL